MLYQSISLPQTEKTFDSPENGTVIKEIRANQDGRVDYDATTWPAKLYPTKGNQDALPVGEKVRIVAQEGTTLWVMPEHQVFEQGPQPNPPSNFISHWLREKFSLCI